ncbi:MAG: hypothetical protein U0168_27880 [Nannocystaceae bacterium]
MENGGTLLASGYLLKECTLDGNSPGNDLFMDCVPLGMVCRDSFISGYCTLSSWLGSECSSDADCDPGGVCVTRFDLDGSVAFSYCYIDCSTSELRQPTSRAGLPLGPDLAGGLPRRRRAAPRDDLLHVVSRPVLAHLRARPLRRAPTT